MIKIKLKKKLDVVMHPIRMRIIQTLITKKGLSTQQISEYLPDVPQATLYRHLNKLVHADIIKPIQENKIRGAVEKIYALSDDGVNLTEEDVDKISREEHFQYFFSFLTNLMGDFDDYLKRDYIDINKDGVTYRQANIYLSDQELQNLMEAISKLILNQIDNKPTKGRKLINISNIIIPK